jgi:hypothetical protein
MRESPRSGCSSGLTIRCADDEPIATAIPVTPTSMNYASVVFAGFSAVAALWYAINARKHYHGPTGSAIRTTEAA